MGECAVSGSARHGTLTKKGRGGASQRELESPVCISWWRRLGIRCLHLRSHKPIARHVRNHAGYDRIAPAAIVCLPFACQGQRGLPAAIARNVSGSSIVPIQGVPEMARVSTHCRVQGEVIMALLVEIALPV